MAEALTVGIRIFNSFLFMFAASNLHNIAVIEHQKLEALKGIEKNTQRISTELSGELKNIHYQTQRYVNRYVGPPSEMK